ncbi:receptor-like cytosolic serine/threonine-protein kinase RBK2 isoform X2 [Hevea brasiliensis]|uniref:receptor-like cytosolic serine/threonine-protein kinase RBK2 isoform X2 n=1 Tax=Hevea brasiliensis TaxID=3981 RepID=UPI0025D628C5|nr:receptor-like cytosolic serine/threonine-protein kinase RBK2 isoform X2 [Hevea brasiliensis]
MGCFNPLWIFSYSSFSLKFDLIPSFYIGSNGSLDTAREDQENEDIPVAGRTIKRHGFSDTFSSNELRTLKAEEEEEEEEDDDVKSSPRGGPEDCSISLESETLSKDSTSNSLESETASRASTSGSEGQLNPLVATHWRDFFRGLKKGAARRIQTFPPPKKHGPRLTRSKTKRIREELIPVISSPLDTDLYCLKSSWKNFTLSEIKTATNNFSHENLIGEGGYAEVYKGQLKDGQLVAIKRLTRGSPEEMTVDFLSELGMMVHVDHPNIAKVIGYGVEGGMHLVLQLSAHGSLASILYGPKEKLDWGMRYKIATGTADGLQYLHEGCQRRIIHKDIKASNILLSEEFDPQISDFGLAKWLPEHWTHHTVSKVEGTFGYLPPEFFMHGIVDEKTDVYAYGVLLLELITGKQAIDSSQQSLVLWAKPLLMKNSIKKLVDPTLVDAYDKEQMEVLTFLASSCIHQSSMQRPQMNQIVEILKGNKDALEEIKELQKSIHQRTYSEELFDADEYNSTKYLNDMNKHMEIVLGQCDSPKIAEEL